MTVVNRMYETEYNVGDVVLFKKYDYLLVGIIEGFYIDDRTFWFNLRTSTSNVYSYSNGGDVPEWDIVWKIPDDMSDKIRKHILNPDDDDSDENEIEINLKIT